MFKLLAAAAAALAMGIEVAANWKCAPALSVCPIAKFGLEL